MQQQREIDFVPILLSWFTTLRTKETLSVSSVLCCSVAECYLGACVRGASVRAGERPQPPREYSKQIAMQTTLRRQIGTETELERKHGRYDDDDDNTRRGTSQQLQHTQTLWGEQFYHQRL